MTKLTENVSAISAVFHQDKRFRAFQDKFSDSVQGFPGIWRYVAQMAEQFTKAEYRGCWDNHDWIESVDSFVNALYAAPDLLSYDEARQAARKAIDEN